MDVRQTDTAAEQRRHRDRRDPHPCRQGAPGARAADVDIARRCFFRLNRSASEEPDDYDDLLDADVEWTPTTALLDGRTHRGIEAVREWVDNLRRDWRVYEIKWTEVRDLGAGRVLAFGRWDCIGRRDGVAFSYDQAAWLIELRGGKLIRLQSFGDRSEAVEAARLGSMSRAGVELGERSTGRIRSSSYEMGPGR